MRVGRTAEVYLSEPISIMRSVGSRAILSPSFMSIVAVTPLKPSALIAPIDR